MKCNPRSPPAIAVSTDDDDEDDDDDVALSTMQTSSNAVANLKRVCVICRGSLEEEAGTRYWFRFGDVGLFSIVDVGLFE